MLISSVTCPKSVAILILVLPSKILNPQDSIASWGVLKGWLVKSPMIKS